MSGVTLPFVPRDYQKRALKAFRAGARYMSLEWHRKSGKEMTCWNIMLYSALTRPGPYCYFFPTYGQAKRVVWEGTDRDGNRFISHYAPPSIVKRKNETELLLELRNGAIIRLIGLDKYTKDTVVGANPFGCVFSEYALQDPAGWQFMSPVIAQNEGWAIFNFTPRGENHATDQHDKWLELAKTDTLYFAETLTVEDTKIAGMADIVARERLTQPEEIIQQEYFCSRIAMMRGAYFGPYVEKARSDGRVTTVPFDSRLPVHTAWDVGVNDPTAIWFFQTDIGGAIRFIHYYEESKHTGAPGFPSHLANLKQLQRERGYVYGVNIAPHDMAVTEWGSETSRVETAALLGFDFVVTPRVSHDESVEAVRALFSRFVFDGLACAKGLKAVGHYQAEYDELHKVYKATPLHDWSSHGAAALRTLALGFEKVTNDVYGSEFDRERPKQRMALTDFDVLRI